MHTKGGRQRKPAPLKGCACVQGRAWPAAGSVLNEEQQLLWRVVKDRASSSKNRNGTAAANAGLCRGRGVAQIHRANERAP